MALKEKALRRLADKLNAAGLVWCAMGDWALSVQGIGDTWHGFDLLVAEDGLEKADKVLTRMGMRHEEPDGVSAFRAAYHFDGADITLTCGLAVQSGDTVYHAVMNADCVGGHQQVLGADVPTLRLENELTLALLRGDEKRAQLLRERVQPAPDAVQEPLPDNL